jgi:hypothetical protein
VRLLELISSLERSRSSANASIMTGVHAALRIRASSVGTPPSIFARRVVVTFAQGSVANRALRQMFDNPNEQGAEPCRLCNGHYLDAEKRLSRAGLPH